MVLGEQSVALKQLKFGTLTYIALNSVLCTVNRLFGNVQTHFLNNIYCENLVLNLVRIMMATTNCKCPRCAGYTVRIRRRYSDRIISLFSPVHRYQCQDYNCKWQGKVSVKN